MLTRHSRAAFLPAPRRRSCRDAMAESGGCAGSAAASHVFGVCDLCGEETDQSLAPLVLVQCNQKACPDRRADEHAPSRARLAGAACFPCAGVFGAKRLSAPRLTRRARRVYHQDCLLDHLESASASRRRAPRAAGEPLAQRVTRARFRASKPCAASRPGPRPPAQDVLPEEADVLRPRRRVLLARAPQGAADRTPGGKPSSVLLAT